MLNLLLPCHSLESLHFHDCRDTFITGKLFSNRLVLNHLKIATPNLKELCLANNTSYLSDALLDRFMAMVSHVKYLSFSCWYSCFFSSNHIYYKLMCNFKPHFFLFDLVLFLSILAFTKNFIQTRYPMKMEVPSLQN